MARTITREGMVYASFPIEKQVEDESGDLIIYGRATDGTIDSDKQIVDPIWSGPALERWLQTKANIRVQHSPHLYPAGKGVAVEVDRDGDNGHWVKARIVEDTAKKLVKAGVLSDFSVGIANPVVIRDRTGKAAGGIVTGNDQTEIAELSIVDRGANYNSAFRLAKSAGDDTPWTLGDLDGLLAKAEAADLVKSAGPEDEADDEASERGSGEPDDESGMDPVLKAYKAAVAEWQAREPRSTGDATTGTAFLMKQASRDAWHRWDDEGETGGLDGSPEGFARWAAKRDVRPEVGGGVDVDKLPADDFVDPKGRRFPIAKPGDVTDAVHSYGRADPLIPMKRFRHRLTAIAHRKGAAYVAELPESWGDKEDMATADVVKNITLTDPDPTGLVPYNLVGATKGAKNCKCGESYDADSKVRRCEGCGRKLPKGNAQKGATVDKGKKRRMVPDDVKPAGEHREPDGDAVEALEADAGMHTDPDPTHDKVPASVMKDDSEPDGEPDDDEDDMPADPKGKKPFPGAAKPFGAKSASPYQVQRMHDALCAAYPWDSVADQYPSLKSVSDAMVPAWFGEQVTAAAVKGDMRRVAALAGSAEEASLIEKGMFDPAVLADGRAEVHKSFQDMYPSAHLTPGAPPQPGQFQRPYISTGHSPLSAGMASAAPNVPPASHVPYPDQFDRPLITAGHQAESPGDQPGNLDTGGSVATGASRTFYANASKAAARVAMQAMHDHIVATQPDMCPMAPSRAVMPADMGNTNRPTPVTPPVIPKAPGEKSTAASVTKTSGPSTKDIRRIVKSAVADAIKDVRDPYETQIAALRAEIDELGAQPDPAQAPLRGVVRKAATIGDTPAPAEKVSLIEQAQRNAATEMDEYVQHLRQLTKSDNPATREQADRVLSGLLTKAS